VSARPFVTALLAALLAVRSTGGITPAHAQVTSDAPSGLPTAVVDLTERSGVELVRAEWLYSDARIVEVDHRAPGPDLRASGPPIRTHDVDPHAGAADFDDSGWTPIAPEELEARRGSGRLSFNWYRIRLTIPERIGDFDPTGATVIFEVVVDDYAEVWVDGRLPVVLGQTGGPLVKGFNAPNRIVITRAATPGQEIQLAIFGTNAPLSNPPANFIWIRSATLDFFEPAASRVGVEVAAEIERRDPAIDAIVAPGARVERLASGFLFTEGPVWVRDGGYLLFSDPNANRIYRWSPDGQVSVYRTKSGYTGFDIGEYRQPGSNGLAVDAEGRLLIAEHGNRRITRLERNGVLTVLADRYQGRRLNSPNDLVLKSDGSLYFTDPPFGLPQFEADPRKELPFSGVFLLKDGRLRLVATDLRGPNGIAFSPDERFLYVTNWDVEKKVVMRYTVAPDGSLREGSVFFDMTDAPGEEALDGIEVDVQGNLYVSGPGGVWVISPTGSHLGTIRPPELPANFAWGDEDGRTLYMTARTGLYRLRLQVAGSAWSVPGRLSSAGP
jgi:gluconolactonase